jgi:hypothetical protein
VSKTHESQGLDLQVAKLADQWLLT